MATPPIVGQLSSTTPLQPYAGAGLVYRQIVANSTGAAFALSVSNNSLSGLTGLVNIVGTSICTTPAYITSTTATMNSDTTLGPSTGPWVFNQSDTRACDWAITVISKT